MLTREQGITAAESLHNAEQSGQQTGLLSLAYPVKHHLAAFLKQTLGLFGSVSIAMEV